MKIFHDGVLYLHYLTFYASSQRLGVQDSIAARATPAKRHRVPSPMTPNLSASSLRRSQQTAALRLRSDRCYSCLSLRFLTTPALSFQKEPISYSLLINPSSLFSISAESGEISLTRSIDYEGDQHRYLLLVRANEGVDSLSSAAEVRGRGLLVSCFTGYFVVAVCLRFCILCVDCVFTVC